MLGLLLVAFSSGEGEREARAQFGLGEGRRGEEREGERWFVCGWFSATAERKRTKRSKMKLIKDITQTIFARLRLDERHEPRGGGWSLLSNSLAIFG